MQTVLRGLHIGSFLLMRIDGERKIFTHGRYFKFPNAYLSIMKKNARDHYNCDSGKTLQLYLCTWRRSIISDLISLSLILFFISYQTITKLQR